MPRYGLIDGLRGFFLVFMLINHLVFQDGYWMSHVNHNKLAFVEDAQGFVFLSGLMIGLVYGRKMLKLGYVAGRRQVWRRAFQLYRWAMGIVVAVLVARAVLPGAPQAWGNWLGHTALTGDPLRLAAIATFLFQPTVMDILPQYVLYMLVAPPLLRWCLDGHVVPVATASLILWIAAQLSLQRVVTDPLGALVTTADGQGIRASFNLLAWQLVFFSGMIAGALTASGRVDWHRLFRADHAAPAKIALAVCLFFAPLRLFSAYGMLPQWLIDRIDTLGIRGDFGPIYLINFAAASIGLTWLLIAGPAHPRRAVQRAAAWARGLFSLSYLRLLGRHSLHVYVWHVAIVYAVFYVDQRHGPFTQWLKTLVALAGIVLLSLPALWRERRAA
ncbi:OpgC family protein [uncultured Sphingomonas sp.]|uniref:OpgC family protein n=1 Tax=uncultured Sphingomonas sp. TaxID=158754 RepID=UPI00374950F9